MAEGTKPGWRERWRAARGKARTRETKWVMSFNFDAVNRRLLVLLVIFIGLNFLDAMTTLIGISAGPSFVEYNPIAAGLFRSDFPGFLAALAFKYLPVVPFAYVTFVGRKGSAGLGIRMVKVGAFVALVAADLFYLFVVGSISLTLATFYQLG